MKNIVENYPFMTKILQIFSSLYNIFFQKAIQKFKNKKFAKSIDKYGKCGV